MKARTLQILKVVLFFAVGIAFIWVFVSQLSDNEIAEMFDSVRQANYFWVVVVFVISVMSCYVRALRWRQMLKPMGYAQISIHKAFFAIMVGYLTNLAVPRLGEVVRCAMLRKSDKVPVEQSFGTVITERAIDLLLFVLVFLLAVLLEIGVISDYLQANFDKTILDRIQLLLIIGVVCATFAVLLFFMVKRRFANNRIFVKINKLFSGLWQGICSIKHLDKPLLFVFYSLLIWLLWIASTFAIFKCFDASFNLDFEVSIVVTALSAIGPMMTPGGIGLYPAIFAQTLLVYSIAKPTGYAAGWLSWLISQTANAVLGMAGFIYFSKIQKNDSCTKD